MILGACAAAACAHGADTPDRAGSFDPEVARRFAGVAGWQGFWETTETRSVSRSNDAGYINSAYEGSGHGQFVLSRDTSGWDAARGDFRWRGTGEATGTQQETKSSWTRYGDGMVGEDWREESGGHAAMRDVEFTIWMNRQYVSLHAGSGTESATTRRREGRAVVAQSGADGEHRYEQKAINETSPGSILTFFIPNYEKTRLRQWAVVRGGPGVLAFGHEERANDATLGPTIRRSRVVLTPVYDDVECEVTIEGYATWRPKGSIEEPSKPGNALIARAVLKPRGGKAKELPEVERFRFELLDTSREPGVCLNWPLGAKDEDYDLRFADLSGGTSAESMAALRKFVADWGLMSGGDYDLASMPEGGMPGASFGEVSDDGQQAELAGPPKDKSGQPFADVAIESFDFGAKAELRVVCVLKDGREIIGLMKGDDGGQDLVRLPKRAGPDWVAEAWRRKHDAMNLAAGDDNESVDGQPMNGDGFTLYEEYRGWAENGRHIEGDPKRKDFFVLNRIGLNARPGIELFEQLSQLRVHSRLRLHEMSPEDRLMNGNHRDAPHRVNQHGVWVKTFTRATLGDTGATTPMTKAGVAGRPGLTKGVGILARNDSESLFNKPFNLPAQDAIFAYDRAIAHELLHAVGVEHHGTGDGNQIVGYVSPRNPYNKVGRPYYARSLSDPPLVLLDEAGHDVATRDYVDYVKMREYTELAMLERTLDEGRKYIARNGVGWGGIHTPEQYANTQMEILIIYVFMHLKGTVGVQHGEHSGDQDCVMRYYFAKFYESTGRTDGAQYVATPGTERIGLELCRAATGTGINAPGHRPQSRYGHAKPGEGNCFSQICPNDAIPPRKL